jgi:hypothetical protein
MLDDLGVVQAADGAAGAAEEFGGQNTRLRKAGASSNHTGLITRSVRFGTEYPISPGKYQRTSTKRSRKS